MKKHALAVCALLVLSGASTAQTISVGSGTGPQAGGATTPALTPVIFTQGGTAVADFTARVNFDAAKLTATAAGANGGSCSVGAGFVTVLPPPGQSNLATNTYCNISFSVVAASALGPTPLTPTTTFPGGGCVDNAAANVNCTLTPGAIDIQAGPVPVSPTLTYAPAPNAAPATVTFSGGAVGGTGNSTISVTPAGAANGGTTTVTACAVSGITGTGTFGTPTVTGSPFSATAGSIGLSCVRAAAATTATLTCTETESDGAPAPQSRVWGLTCPAGTVNTYTATAALTYGNQNVATTSAAQNIAVVAPGGNTGNVSITGCTFGGTNPADFAFSPTPTFPVAVAPGATVNLPVTFTPAAAGARAGSVTCQTANASAASFTTNFTGTGVAAAASFTSTPASGTTITLPAAVTGQTTSAGVAFNNTGNASGTMTCAATGTGFSVIPTGAQTIGAGASLTFTVSASSVTPGTLTGTLTCTPSVGTAFTFPLSAVINQALVQQIPAFGDFGRWALLGLMAGLGAMVAFRKRG